MEITRAEAAAVWDLRHRVLRADQPRETARWPGDDEAMHWTLRHEGAIVAVLSVFPSPQGPTPWQLRGMAVDPSRQGQGLGARLLRAVEQWMFHELPGQNLWCNARIGAVGFYERAGWRVVSAPFEIPGVGVHVRMLRELSRPGPTLP